MHRMQKSSATMAAMWLALCNKQNTNALQMASEGFLFAWQPHKSCVASYKQALREQQVLLTNHHQAALARSLCRPSQTQRCIWLLEGSAQAASWHKLHGQQQQAALQAGMWTKDQSCNRPVAHDWVLTPVLSHLKGIKSLHVV